MTGFRPSGWCDRKEPIVELENPFGFNFKSLLRGEHLIEFSGVILISIAGSDLLPILADFVLEYTFTGKIRDLSGPNGDAMVEFGVSRFKKQAAQTDEPLTILAFVTFFEQEKLTFARYLEEAAKGSNPLATVPLGYLEPHDSDFGQTILSLANQALQIPDRKRKNSDEIEGARPKRQRRGTDLGIGQKKGNGQIEVSTLS